MNINPIRRRFTTYSHHRDQQGKTENNSHLLLDHSLKKQQLENNHQNMCTPKRFGDLLEKKRMEFLKSTIDNSYEKQQEKPQSFLEDSISRFSIMEHDEGQNQNDLKNPVNQKICNKRSTKKNKVFHGERQLLEQYIFKQISNKEFFVQNLSQMKQMMQLMLQNVDNFLGLKQKDYFLRESQPKTFKELKSQLYQSDKYKKMLESNLLSLQMKISSSIKQLINQEQSLKMMENGIEAEFLQEQSRKYNTLLNEMEDHIVCIENYQQQFSKRVR